MSIKVYKNSILTFSDKEYRCIIGQNGLTTNKLEGDKKTPVGQFKISHVLFREDRLNIHQINLKTRKILSHDGWCDDPINIKYNQSPTIKNKGSAIFLHLTNKNYNPTSGCVALLKTDFLKILPFIDKKTKIIIS